MKKALNIIGDVLLGVIIVFAIVGIIFALTSKKNRYGLAEFFGKSASVVQTDSMDPTIKVGDMVFCDSKVKYTDLDDDDKYQIEDKNRETNPIVFYHKKVGDQTIVVVHRIYEKVYNETTGVLIGYTLWGDNNSSIDIYENTSNPVILNGANYIGVYTGTRLPVIGSIVDFLSTTLGFGLCIVLPIFIYLIIQIFRLVKVVMNNKKVDMLEAAAAGVQDESVKEAIIQEYLRKQEEEKANKEAGEQDKASKEEKK